MSYSNNGCNTCQQPIPATCVTGPPACTGTECDEIYPGACVVYSGPDIPCLGVTNGMSLNDIMQAIADTLCAEACCTNPVQWLLQYAKDIYDIQLAKGLTPVITNILGNLISNGIVTNSCNTCCPDYEWYIISDKTTVGNIRTDIGVNGPATNGGIAKFTDCIALMEARDVTIPNRFIDDPSDALSGTEWGSIQGQSTMCLFNSIFDSTTFSGSILYDILDMVITIGLTVECESGLLRILSMEDF